MNDATFSSTNRPIIAILENYQNEDGSINIPLVLQKWMGKEKIEVRK
jgi:seryl-tRNA synthetase